MRRPSWITAKQPSTLEGILLCTPRIRKPSQLVNPSLKAAIAAIKHSNNDQRTFRNCAVGSRSAPDRHAPTSTCPQRFLRVREGHTTCVGRIPNAGHPVVHTYTIRWKRIILPPLSTMTTPLRHHQPPATTIRRAPVPSHLPQSFACTSGRTQPADGDTDDELEDLRYKIQRGHS